MVGYLALALVCLAALMGACWKGYSLGSDHVRAEWAEAAAASVKAAADEADRQRAESRKAAQALQASLGKQKRLNADLTDALTKHIAAIPAPPAGCPEPALTPSLLDDWNAANAGSEGAAGRSLPSVGGTAATADRSKPAGDGHEPLGGR